MKRLKHSFLGYTGQSVQSVLSVLEEQVRELRSANETRTKEIEHLQESLQATKAEEELIREAIVDAKHLSKRLVEEAQLKAREMVSDAEQQLQSQYLIFERSLTELKDSRQELVRHKEDLRQELEATLERYRHKLLETGKALEEAIAKEGHSEDSDYHSLSSEAALEAIEHKLDSITALSGSGVADRSSQKLPKQMIVLPKDLPQGALSSSRSSKTSRTSYGMTGTGLSRFSGENWSEEVPVYSPF